MVYGFELISIVLLFSLNFSAITGFFHGDKVDLKLTSFGGGTTGNNTRSVVVDTLGTAPTFFIILLSFLVSFGLLALEWKKSWKVIQSRDISYAFTSIIAYRYYCIRSYPHYCFFNQIQNSRKTVDILAFWVFFKLRGWMRLLFAEFPRQFLSASILYFIWDNALQSQKGNFVFAIEALFDPKQGAGVPKIIIAEILKKKSKKRIQDLRRQERERIQNGSEYSSENQPTLPTIDFEDDHYAPSVGHSEGYASTAPYGTTSVYYPPQSQYSPPSQYGASQYSLPNQRYPQYSEYDQQYQYNQRSQPPVYADPRRAYADDDASSYQSSQDSRRRNNQRPRYDNGTEYSKSQYTGSPNTPPSGKANPNIKYTSPPQKESDLWESSDPYSQVGKSDFSKSSTRTPNDASKRANPARDNSHSPVDRDANRSRQKSDPYDRPKSPTARQPSDPYDRPTSPASNRQRGEQTRSPPPSRHPSDPFDKPKASPGRQISESFDTPRSGRQVAPKESRDSYFSDDTSIPDANDLKWRK
ncbi:hypothetical protein HK103_000413 [Boothiomyces macroporosus]|uniref:Uncharacterized protein n=1 Tax=Boothiomyces macroporosus TaxID=261099 RepID=A0AAD5UBF8_9FUNG|nr:hypothetical protein HK103_000413 [Boothiomyces macroporosus]